MSLPPKWFTDALAAPFDTGRATVEGCEIHFLGWGNPDLPGLIFIHGGLAHAHWWRYIAPYFSGHYHVVALDLSGHGDSGHRAHYPKLAWAHEVVAVAQRALPGRKPILVGHSMGGLVTATLLTLFPENFKAGVIIDTPLHKPPRQEPEQGGGRSFDHIKPYPDLETGMSRFRFLPDQPCEHRFIVDHLARTSLKKTGDGWIWKFDPTMFVRMEFAPIEMYLPKIKAPIAFFRGEYSTVVPKDIGDLLAVSMGRRIPCVEVPNAHHHLILDQPLAFIAGLRAVLALWETILR